MSEITIFCGCNGIDCPLKLCTKWLRYHIVVTVWDDVGSTDKRIFTYQEFIDEMECMETWPPYKDGEDTYCYDFDEPMRGMKDTTTFHIRSTNRNDLIARTKEMASVYNHEVRTR